MAYYTVLINAWNSATQPPTGVNGTPLTGGMTTAQKLAAVNGWTITVPQPAHIPVTSIIAAIVPADFLGLTTLQLQQLQFLLAASDTVFAPIGGTVRSVFGTIFAGKATTLANLAALVATFDNATIPWWQSVGYPGPFSQPDATAAGLV